MASNHSKPVMATYCVHTSLKFGVGLFEVSAVLVLPSTANVRKALIS
jgi:hypothetical protein